jgi:hypothetical protein
MKWLSPRHESRKKKINHQGHEGTELRVPNSRDEGHKKMDPFQKCPSVFVVVPTGRGSFDYVRLTPHFAQDDKVWRVRC